MGAQTFTKSVRISDVEKAFRTAVDEEAHEHGHGGYTGSLAEKGEYVVITRTPFSEKAAYKFANGLMEKSDQRVNDKWGPAGAIPISYPERIVEVEGLSGERRDEAIRAAAEAALKKKGQLKRGEKIEVVDLWMYSQEKRSPYMVYVDPPRFTEGRARVHIRKADAPTYREVTLEVAVEGDLGEKLTDKLDELVRAKVKLKSNETILEWATARDKSSPGGYKTLVKPVYKVEVEVPKEATETRYVVNSNQEWTDGHRSWAKGFKSQAEARAWVLKKAKEADDSATTKHWEISAVTRRASGSPLVKVHRRLVRTVYTLCVTIEEHHTDRPTIDGWLFFGWASS